LDNALKVLYDEYLENQKLFINLQKEIEIKQKTQTVTEENEDDLLLLQICCQDRSEVSIDPHISLDLELVLESKGNSIPNQMKNVLGMENLKS